MLFFAAVALLVPFLGYFIKELRKQKRYEKQAVEQALKDPVMGNDEFRVGANGAYLERRWDRHRVVRIRVGNERHYYRIGGALFSVLKHLLPNGGRINTFQIFGELRRWGHQIEAPSKRI